MLSRMVELLIASALVNKDMFLKDFYNVHDGYVSIDAEQASMFAKEIAHDFNPLHDVEAKRFCVPGDLLFSLALEKYGLSQNMHFIFSGMVGHDVLLNFPDTDADQIDVNDSQGKTYLQIERSGELSRDSALIESFIRDYVAFSGQNFPYVLVPLLAQENVMFNINRPLVIYESMTLSFHHLDFRQATVEMLEPKDGSLSANAPQPFYTFRSTQAKPWLAQALKNWQSVCRVVLKQSRCRHLLMNI